MKKSCRDVCVNMRSTFLQGSTDEVAQVAWMDREQIKELFEQKMFVGTLEYFFTEVDK